ncbi:MAG: hypothetical protein SFZ23_11445 [Planctomycetota bacterium]|nr:hypothetical protein [Planctomycetota bacterium]
MALLARDRSALGDRAAGLVRTLAPPSAHAVRHAGMTWAAALWGGTAMTALGETPDADVCIVASWMLARVSTPDAGWKRYAELASSYVKGVTLAATTKPELRLLHCTMHCNSVIAQSLGLRGQVLRWSPADLERGSLARGNASISLQDALSWCMTPTLVFGVLDDLPWLLDVAFDFRWGVDRAGERSYADIGGTISSLWFGHLCATRNEATTFASFEAELSRVLGARYDAQQIYHLANEPSVMNSARAGEWTKVAKRLCVEAALEGDTDAVAALAGVSGGVVGRVRAEASRCMNAAALASLLDAEGERAALERARTRLLSLATGADLASLDRQPPTDQLFAAVAPTATSRADPIEPLDADQITQGPATALTLVRAAKSVVARADGHARSQLATHLERVRKLRPDAAGMLEATDRPH